MMAQQAALRIHAARQGQGVVALHPLSHPQLRESDALTAVAGLSTLPLGDPARCLAADDLRRVRDRVDVLMPEPPLRAAGDRKRVVWGTSVSVRVDLGGRRRIKKKK